MEEEKEATGQTEPAVGVTEIKSRIAAYRAQLETTNQQLQALEQSYQQQREIGVQSIHQLAGAISALEGLLAGPNPKTE